MKFLSDSIFGEKIFFSNRIYLNAPENTWFYLHFLSVVNAVRYDRIDKWGILKICPVARVTIFVYFFVYLFCISVASFLNDVMFEIAWNVRYKIRQCNSSILLCEDFYARGLGCAYVYRNQDEGWYWGYRMITWWGRTMLYICEVLW